MYGFVNNDGLGWVDVLGRDPFHGPTAPPGTIWGVPGDGPAPTEAEIKAAQAICDGYPSPATKCIRNGVSTEDDYPIKAKEICKDFMKMFSKTAGQFNRAKGVARCLVAAEPGCQKPTCCKERNACRFEAHVKCYAVNNFTDPWWESDTPWDPTNPKMPKGAHELGWESLLPDWIEVRLPLPPPGPAWPWPMMN